MACLVKYGEWLDHNLDLISQLELTLNLTKDDEEAIFKSNKATIEQALLMDQAIFDEMRRPIRSKMQATVADLGAPAAKGIARQIYNMLWRKKGVCTSFDLAVDSVLTISGRPAASSHSCCRCCRSKEVAHVQDRHNPDRHASDRHAQEVVVEDRLRKDRPREDCLFQDRTVAVRLTRK